MDSSARLSPRQQWRYTAFLLEYLEYMKYVPLSACTSRWGVEIGEPSVRARAVISRDHYLSAWGRFNDLYKLSAVCIHVFKYERGIPSLLPRRQSCRRVHFYKRVVIVSNTVKLEPEGICESFLFWFNCFISWLGVNLTKSSSNALLFICLISVSCLMQINNAHGQW